ncbi:sensor histidine kinase [Parabacteroides pacaensis]|uniref:sensor histidine kinase n=1 Tax=Parabacteroides pacaensis TaxID=2086575 RepID=UPI000D10334F|nr:PAS domain-containing sensor histidine kinase [Parabacteroides pacaensis]
MRDLVRQIRLIKEKIIFRYVIYFACLIALIVSLFFIYYLVCSSMSGYIFIKSQTYIWLCIGGLIAFLCMVYMFAKLEYYSCTMTDMKDSRDYLKEVNDLYRLMLRSAKMATWTFDIPADRMECDLEFLSDKSPLPDHLALRYTDFLAMVHPEDRDKMATSFNLLRDKREKIIDGEFRLMLAGEKERFIWMELFFEVKERDEKGNAKFLVGVAININHRKKLEQVKLEQEKIKQSHHLMSAFFANMNHEIRTPLNAIVGFSSLLAEAETEEEKRSYRFVIETNTQLLLNLIDDILESSKIEAESFRFTCVEVDVNQLLEGIERNMSQACNDKNIFLSFTSRISRCVIVSDPFRLTQVINHLIKNAMKFTAEGSVNFGYYLQEDSSIHFFVKDTGCGIPQDKQEAIFERFVKLDSFAQGTGLGLYVCKMIIDKLGGRMGVRSEVGNGAYFWFTLPATFQRVTVIDGCSDTLIKNGSNS